MTNALYITDNKIGIDVTKRTTGTTTDGANAIFTLGSRATGNNGTVWLYVQANGAIGASDATSITNSFQAASLTNANAGIGLQIGFGGNTAWADNDLGWMPISGDAGLTVNVTSATTAGVALYTTTTAGQLSSSSSAASGTAQTKIQGLTLVSTADSTTVTAANVIATYPRSL